MVVIKVNFCAEAWDDRVQAGLQVAARDALRKVFGKN